MKEQQEIIRNNFYKISAEKETFNLAELYYNINTTFEEVSKMDIITLTITAKIIEIQECLKESDDLDKKVFFQKQYIDEIVKLIANNTKIMDRLRVDSDIIKKELKELMSSYK